METLKYLVKNVNNIIHARINDVPQKCSNPGDQLRSDRLLSKFYDIYDETTTDLRAVALRGFLEHLERERPTFSLLQNIAASYSMGRGPEDQRRLGHVLLKARSILRTWLRDYKPMLCSTKSYVGPRMNAVYSGHLSELHKLCSAERWPCQPRAVPLLRKIAIRNPIMRRRCKDVGRKYVSSTTYQTYFDHYKPLSEYTGDQLFEIGFRLLTVRRTPFEKDVLTTVPKNNKTDRVIAMCTIGDQVAESAVAFGVEECLVNAGCFLHNDGGFDGQYWHRKHIADKRVATIDFSAASDSNYWEVCKFFFSGSSLLNDLEKVRVRSVVIGDECIAVPMLATMGRRICFVTMTMILAALACAVTGRSCVERSDPLSPQVYGDDVIIENTHAPLFIEVANLVGYRVNVSKTFVNSKFRESCGSYYHDDFGYLTSFDFKPAVHIQEAIALTNKALINYMESIDDCSKVFWYDLWKACFDVLEEFRGPIPSRWDDELGSWCFDPDFEETKGTNKQTEWLSGCLQTDSLSTIIGIGVESLEHKFSFGELMYARFLAYRDGHMPCHSTNTTYVKQRIVVDRNGLRYGEFSSLRATRAQEIKLNARWTLIRFSRALGANPEEANFLANHGSSDLWRVRNFVMSS